MIFVDEATVTDDAAVDPNDTVAPEEKFVPVIVTEVPPAVEPADGLTWVTVGCVTEVYSVELSLVNTGAPALWLRTNAYSVEESDGAGNPAPIRSASGARLDRTRCTPWPPSGIAAQPTRPTGSARAGRSP